MGKISLRLPGCSRIEWLPECQHTSATAIEPATFEPTTFEPTTFEFQPTTFEPTTFEFQPTTLELQPTTG